LVGLIQNFGSNSGDKRQNDSENTEPARPISYQPLVSLVIGFGLSFAAMIVAFESAEYADENGFRLWWMLLIGFAGLSLWLAHSALATFDRRSEYVGVLPIIVTKLKLSDVEWEIFAADFVEATDDPALEDRPETLRWGVRIRGVKATEAKRDTLSYRRWPRHLCRRSGAAYRVSSA
jgi:hypothetical protein